MDDRHNAVFGKHVGGGLEIRIGFGRLDAVLLEQRLVVEEGRRRDPGERDAPDLALDRERRQGAFDQPVFHLRHQIVDRRHHPVLLIGSIQGIGGAHDEVDLIAGELGRGQAGESVRHRAAGIVNDFGYFRMLLAEPVVDLRGDGFDDFGRRPRREGVPLAGSEDDERGRVLGL